MDSDPASQPDFLEDSEEEDYDEDGDDDIDAEAQEMARRLGQELWADISRATAGKLTTSSTTIDPGTLSTTTRKSDAAITTMRSILSFVENDPLACSTLSSSLVPTSDGGNVLDVLKHAATSGIIKKSIAVPLSQVIMSLARSEILFGDLRHSTASSIQPDNGKRKREETDLGQSQNDSRANKRQFVPSADLQTQVTEAVRVIIQAFGTSSTQPLDPTLVSSIRLQLHQVFLFAVTSSAGGGCNMHALQEISGLIQVVGVLSGIQIGQTPISHSQSPPTASASNQVYPWLPSPTPTDIGTAVYPCLIAGCRKTFSRLYYLRAHQRIHTLHRPFRCKICPASFARNHDLKRHVKLHDKKAWKCGGCLKVFSRRDAIKRHKDGSKARGSKSGDCVDAQVLEVEIDPEYGDEAMREERRAKIWNGIAIGKASASSSLAYGSQVEEGEIQPSVIASIQSAVISLHGLLQAHVGNALGSPLGQAITPPLDPTGSQATLASVIARAQLQNLPPEINTTQSTVHHLDSANQFTGTQATSPIAETSANIDGHTTPTPIPSLSMYGLSDEQTQMLEEAIANAAAAAQAQAEAEAALEEEEEHDEDQDDDGSEGSEDQADPE